MSSAPSASPVSAATTAPPPASAPNGTPLLRGFVRSRSPASTWWLSPNLIEPRTIDLVSWSAINTIPATISARRQVGMLTARGARPSALAVDCPDDQAADQEEHEDRDHRAEIEP